MQIWDEIGLEELMNWTAEREDCDESMQHANSSWRFEVIAGVQWGSECAPPLWDHYPTLIRSITR
jgi:hypothetical protein